MNISKTDKDGYNEFYMDSVSCLADLSSKDAYIEHFKHIGLSPFWQGGNTKGYVRGLVVDALFHAIRKKGLGTREVRVLDAGCGQGELSVYLAAHGFQVVGVDISEEAIRGSKKLASAIGVTDNCKFLAESLEQLSLQEQSIDFVIGHAALHHFIKYKLVALELRRILKDGGEMFFADAFGENKIYHLFHNKERMQRLGDVILNRHLIQNFFSEFDVEIIPTDWFVMIDKLLLKFFSDEKPLIRKLSRFWWCLDRLVPVNSATLFLSGAVMTHVVKAE